LGPDSLILCVGAGEDILHDVALAAETGARVHVVDPTPRAVAHVCRVRALLEQLEQRGRAVEVPAVDKRLGGGDPEYWPRIVRLGLEGDAGRRQPVRPHQLVLHTVALGKAAGRAAFYPPADPSHVSHSLVQGMTGARRAALHVDVVTLTQLCAAAGRAPEDLDLLKLDVEGAECDVLDAMLDMPGCRPRYLLVEFDLGWRGDAKTRDRARCEALIKRLRAEGYVLLKRDGADHSFVREGK
jgi:FkbM family methyltransferase